MRDYQFLGYVLLGMVIGFAYALAIPGIELYRWTGLLPFGFFGLIGGLIYQAGASRPWLRWLLFVALGGLMYYFAVPGWSVYVGPLPVSCCQWEGL